MADKHFSRRFTIGGAKLAGMTKLNPIKPDHDTSLNLSNIDATLQYNKYLQNLMMGVIAERKIKDQQQQVMCELATVAKERDELESEILKLQLREIDISKLFEAQRKMNAEEKRLKQLYEKANFKTMLDVLNHLYCILQPFDKLCCENVTIPHTLEEWNQVEETLKKTLNTLQSITNVIGNKEQMYKDVTKEIDEFIQVFGKVDGLHKRCTETLYQLQQIILKDGSVSLPQQDNE